MISKVSIRNFKCLRDVQIELERFTVFVGPNASGKSSILQGLNLLCRSFRDQEGSVEGELLQAMSRGSSDSVELAAESGGKGYRYRTRSPSSPDTLISRATSGPHRARRGPAGVAELLPISTRLIGSSGPPTKAINRLCRIRCCSDWKPQSSPCRTPPRPTQQSWHRTGPGFTPRWRAWLSTTRIRGSSCKPTSGGSSPRFVGCVTRRRPCTSPPPCCSTPSAPIRYLLSR